MQATIVDRAAKVVYAIVIGWVLVTAIGMKPWASSQPAAQQQPVAEAVPSPEPVTPVQPSPSPEPVGGYYAPQIEEWVNQFQTWPTETQFAWKSFCSTPDNLIGVDTQTRDICIAVRSLER